MDPNSNINYSRKNPPLKGLGIYNFGLLLDMTFTQLNEYQNYIVHT